MASGWRCGQLGEPDGWGGMVVALLHGVVRWVSGCKVWAGAGSDANADGCLWFICQLT